MNSFFVKDIDNNTASFFDEDIRHILRVLRLKNEDKLIVCFEGKRYMASLNTEGDLSASLMEELESTEAKTKVTLYQALIKNDKMDYAVQKCTELGVYKIVPCHFSRCVVDKDTKRIERLRKIAREAAQQSKRALIPEISDVIDVKALADIIKEHDKVYIAWEEETAQKIQQSYKGAKNIGIIIGPEGGIDKSEIGLLSSALAISLGKRILRAETAGLVLLSAIFTLSGDI